ncbi:MAG: BON domain-containing protein [Acidobacteria bacterium]|nr:BON domain-containing protein [Acidobacteriota bacterium]MCI0624708.1 BON domain-containing protein [Acidobacteriota bacterium]MCI0717909.1 BON domain-containing protein [Acidobacteriota bacterium]
MKVGGAVDDLRIYCEVRRRVVAEPATPKKAIFVDVVNGNVTLRGMVFSVEARDEAVRAAEKTEGAKAVRDLLKVNAPLL